MPKNDANFDRKRAPMTRISFSRFARVFCSALVLSSPFPFNFDTFRWFYTSFVKIRVFEKMVFREPFWTDLFSPPLAFWLLLEPLGASRGPFLGVLGFSRAALWSLLAPLAALLGRPWGDSQNDRFWVPRWFQNQAKNKRKSTTKSNIENVPL